MYVLCRFPIVYFLQISITLGVETISTLALMCAVFLNCLFGLVVVVVFSYTREGLLVLGKEEGGLAMSASDDTLAHQEK